MRSGCRSDQGVALITALLVMGLVTGTSLAMVTLAISVDQDSGVDRKRSAAVAVAESGIDTTYAALQKSGAAVACSPVPETVATSPDQVTYGVTLMYVHDDGSESCPANPLKTVTGAIITSQATSTATGAVTTVRRKMESFVKLAAVPANLLDKAIFGDGAVTFNNNSTILGNAGPDADIYSNTDFTCANIASFAGSVYSQGRIDFSNTCSVAGDLHALNEVQITGNAAIGGDILSSQSDIAVSNQTSVGGVLRAANNITWGGCTGTKCLAGGSVANPPYEEFPIIKGDAATVQQWVDQGFTNVVTLNTCDESSPLSPANWIKNNASSLGANTVIQTNCLVNFQQTKQMKFSHDMIIFSYGGIRTNNQVGLASDVPGQVRRMYWVVPFDATPVRPCTNPPLSTDNLFSITNDIEMLLYSPCDIQFSNNANHIGQVYGGSKVAINNQFDMQFRPLPVFGVSNPPAASYKVDVVYKRETS